MAAQYRKYIEEIRPDHDGGESRLNSRNIEAVHGESCQSMRDAEAVRGESHQFKRDHGPITLCVDMDAFFASVEQKTNPRLRGKPIAVIGSEGRTVVTTASYEARAYGVKTGMNTYEARQACPRIIFVVGNNARYTHTCQEMEKIFLKYTPDVEVYSVDEAFLDITHSHKLFGGPVAVASKIKDEIHELFDIPCTVGIGHNVLMAKLASDLGKPDGLNWIKREDVAGVLESLEVNELWGIGKKTAQKLEKMNIRTCGELGRAPASLLRNKFGIYGETISGMGRGELGRTVTREDDKVKSVGHSMTLPADVSDRGEIETWLLRLSEMVGRRVRRHELMGRRVTLTVRYSDFETVSKRITLEAQTADTHMIYHSALKALDLLNVKGAVRLLGISVSQIGQDHGQMHLMEESRKRRDLLYAMDEVNNRYGDGSATWAALRGRAEKKRSRAGVISPAWRPNGIRNVQLR
jgi:DNA polymerase-4